MTEAELIELLAELPDIVVKDYGDFDDASNLDREGVFRLNVHVGRERLQELVPEADVDPTACDVVMPHPVYAAQGWAAIVNPGEQARELIAFAHARAAARR